MAAVTWGLTALLVLITSVGGSVADHDLARLLSERADRQARAHLVPFTKYTKPDFSVQWFHRAIGDVCDAMVDGTVTRAMFFMPPRHGKSEMVSRRLPAYVLGRNPDAQVIATSYSAHLASRMNRDVQRIIDAPGYLRLFPATRLGGSTRRRTAAGRATRTDDLFEVVDRKGVYRSAGVLGGITGMGMDFGIIDDPIKNRAEAESETLRENIWDWYGSTFLTRMMPGARVLLTLTRWHEDDLAGRLLKRAGEDPAADQWLVVEFPALKEDDSNPTDPRAVGEALWPESFGLDFLAKMRATIGTYQFAALYQQRPQLREGGIFKRTWWRYYDVLPSGHPEAACHSVDAAFKDTDGSDNVAQLTFLKFGPDYYIPPGGYSCTPASFTETCNSILQRRSQFPHITTTLVEDKANGPAVVDHLGKLIAGLIAVDPRGGKIARAFAAEPIVESGHVHLPNPVDHNGRLIPGREWVRPFVENMASFPKAVHDDDVDAFTQGVIYLEGTQQAYLDFLRGEARKRADAGRS